MSGRDDIVLVPRLAEQDALLVIASLERQAREFDRSAAELRAAFGELAARDRAEARRCRGIAERISRLRLAMRHRG
jgi:hypothetical protein